MRRCPKIEYGGMYWEIVEQSANDYRSNNDLMECKQNNNLWARDIGPPTIRFPTR